MQPVEYRLAYGEEVIGIALHPRREGRRLLIKVLPSQQVQAHVPPGMDFARLEKVLRQKARWIWRQLQDFRMQQAHVLLRDYVSGESHFYLGRRYMLRLSHQPDAPEGVRLLRGRLEVSVQEPGAARVRQLLALWYFQHAEQVFTRRLAVLLPMASWVRHLPELRLRVMKTQWGNCSPSGVMTLNPHLIKAPRDCVDYVIMHELCHLAEHNHSPAFWHLLDRTLPDWPRYKTHLDDLAEALLH